MNKYQKKILLETAHEAVRAAVSDEPLPEQRTDDPLLCSNSGCFVTIKNRGSLRGCIGQFISDIALIDLVVQMAKAAATDDPRFFHDPITLSEVSELDIEISVLSPLEKTSDPLSLETGRHGIYIKRGFRSGCLLPQVADEEGWTKEEFLTFCCKYKAGLSGDAWKYPDTEVYLFTAEIISE